jgi:hypothetical protein
MASSVGLQALDLVAQPRGVLEVEIGGGLAHRLFEIGHRRLEIVAEQGRRPPTRPASTGDVVLLVDRAENVGDAALDRSPA